MRDRDLLQRVEHREAALVEVAIAHPGRTRALDLGPFTFVLTGQEAPSEAEVGNARQALARTDPG